MFLYHTLGRRPPRITRRVVNTVTRRWVGAPNGAAPFRFRDAVVGFGRSMSVEDLECRRFEVNIWLLGRASGQDLGGGDVFYVGNFFL